VILRNASTNHSPARAIGTQQNLSPALPSSAGAAIQPHPHRVPVGVTNTTHDALWIVDLQQHRVHFFRSPVDGKYTEVQVCGEPGLTKLTHFSDSDIDLSGLPL